MASKDILANVRRCVVLIVGHQSFVPPVILQYVPDLGNDVLDPFILLLYEAPPASANKKYVPISSFLLKVMLLPENEAVAITFNNVSTIYPVVAVAEAFLVAVVIVQGLVISNLKPLFTVVDCVVSSVTQCVLVSLLLATNAQSAPSYFIYLLVVVSCSLYPTPK